MPCANLLQVALVEDWQLGGFGLYIHWPFCKAKCPYCDFNSHVSRRIDQTRWTDAYLREIDRVAKDTSGRVLNTVFFGGGTPSLMAPETVDAILDRIRSSWTMANDIEVTLEANPGSVEAGRFAGYRDAGVNRISMGIQALNDEDLKRLGRIHTVREARQAFDVARYCFDRVSFDLIYARQNQTLSDWQTELTDAMSMAVDHLSLYQLTIEDGTAFGDRYQAGRLRGLPKDDLAADMYQITQDMCAKNGFPRYEVSNHARPGAESRHNMIYWSGGDYLGIGPGAHGRVTLNGQRHATEAIRNPTPWLDRVTAGEDCTTRETLSQTEVAEEYVMMGLRVNQGIDLKRYYQITGQDLPEGALSKLLELGLLDRDGDVLRSTHAGMLVLNSVIAELLTSQA